MKYILDKSYYGFSFRQLAYIIIVICCAYLIKKLLISIIETIFKRINLKSKVQFDKSTITKTGKPIIFFIYILSIYTIIKILHFSNDIDEVLIKIVNILISLNIAYIFFKIIDLFGYKFKEISRILNSKIDERLILVIIKTLKGFIIIIVGIWIIESLGYSVNSIITSLGIGGLAVALAAKDTISNIFASITILIDKPFGIGDRVKCAKFDGWIEDIGLRCTRIKNIDGSIITLTNSSLVNEPIHNIGKPATLKEEMKIGIPYTTSKEKIEKAISIIKNILTSTEKILKDDIHINLIEFGNYSLNIYVLYFFDSTDYWKFVETNENIFLQIKFEFEKENIEFAIPNHTINIKKIKKKKKI